MSKEGTEFMKKLSPDVAKFMSPCMFEESTGNLSEILEDSQKSGLNALNDLYLGFKAVKENKDFINNPNNSEGAKLHKGYTEFSTFSDVSEFSAFSGSENPFTKANDLNTLISACTGVNVLGDKVRGNQVACAGQAVYANTGSNNACI
jgi:hypothetical protein